MMTALATAVMAAGCQKTDEVTNAIPLEAIFSVSLDDDTTRASGHEYTVDDYFRSGDGAEQITLLSNGNEYTYRMNDQGLLVSASADDVLCYPIDGAPLHEIMFRWPKGSTQAENAVKDQSARAVFLSMDRLEGVVRDVSPSAVVPVRLHHIRTRLTFTPAGDNAGKRIASLTAGDFKAYCDPSLGDAQLILDPQCDLGLIGEGTSCMVLFEGETTPVEYFIPMSIDRGLTAGVNITINI